MAHASKKAKRGYVLGGCAEVGVGHGLGAHPEESELYEPHGDARGTAMSIPYMVDIAYI